MMSSQMEDIFLKILLALFGAVVGLLLKTFSDAYRLHSLLPVVIKQIHKAVSISVKAYTVEEARAAELLFDAGFRSLSELVALGVRPRRVWQRGTELLLEANLAVRVVSGLGGSAAVKALEQLRTDAGNLDQWLKTLT